LWWLVLGLVAAPGLGAAAGGERALQADPGSDRIEAGAGLAQVGGEPGWLAQSDIDADSVRLSADIRESGDATWAVRYRLELDTNESRRAFEELQTDIDGDPAAYLDPFESRLTETVRTAENATGREMSADEFAVSTRTESQPQAAFGIVTFTFEWSGFAAVGGEEIRAGDAVDRLFLESDQRLQLSWPDGYELASRTPAPAVEGSGRVVWRGPIEFAAGQPRIVLTPAGDGFPLALAAGAGVSVLALAGAGYWWLRRDRETQPVEDSPAATASGDDGGTEEPAGGSTGASEPPPELLSNEERLLRLLRENGGRMKQKAVADELDWSAAKTSQVVGDLRDAEEIESFRLGRENILTLPDVEIVEDDDAESS
jgi:hypothetical protein